MTMAGGYGYGPDFNFTALGDMYPGQGTTTGQLVAGASSATGAVGTTQAVAPVGGGHPVVWGAVIVGGLLFLGWLAHRLGRGEDFANPTVSAITVVVSGASAVLFIYVLKLLAYTIGQRTGANGFTVFVAGI